MYIHFWGVRGSVATPLTNSELVPKIESAVRRAIELGLTNVSEVPDFLKGMPRYIGGTIGGDTACIEVGAGEELLILDAGTGIRLLGLDLIRRYSPGRIDAHILLSHTHWDHICGFPFFAPAYISNNKITLYGAHGMLESRLARQQESEYFPVSLDSMAADIQFVQLENYGRFNIGDVGIAVFPLNHPGGCFAYRISHNGRALVYATDSEYRDLTQRVMKAYLEFVHGADILIFDAQYTMVESVDKENWGHSTAFVGIDIALEAGIKNLIFVHHEPTYEDEKLWKVFQGSERYLELQRADRQLALYMAYEGLEVQV